MNLGKNIKQNFLFINRWEVWLFSLLSATLILACTGDLENDGYALVGPSFGVTIIPQNTQVAKATANAVAYAATGGVAPYTYSLDATDIGTITAAGVFTSLAIAGTATVRAVDSTGVSGTTTVTVSPIQLVITPGSAVITAAGNQEFTAALISGSGEVVCSVSRDDPSGTTTMPTVVANAFVCTVSAAAIPTSGTETFTILITDTQDGDHGSAKLTLGAP